MDKTIIEKAFPINIIKENTPKVQALLDEKGFACTTDLIYEKVALLHTEIAELTDAFKKGKGKESESEEIADIIIRLLNFPIMLPQLLENLDNKDIQNEFTIELDKDNEYQCKCKISCMLHRLVCDIESRLQSTLFVDTSKDTNKFPDFSCFEICVMIMAVIVICEFYNQNYIGGNLQDFITAKMKKNHNRPYRYNTSKENFK